jgi:hypothetical protein
MNDEQAVWTHHANFISNEAQVEDRVRRQIEESCQDDRECQQSSDIEED